MKLLLIGACFITYLLHPNMTHAKAVNVDNQPVDLHMWEVQKEAHHEIPIYTHEFNVWHHFIQKRKTCNVTNKIITKVKYCKVHDHYETEVISEEVIHSHQH